MNLFIIKTKPNRIESIGFALGRFFVFLRNTFHPYGTFVFQAYFFTSILSLRDGLKMKKYICQTIISWNCPVRDYILVINKEAPPLKMSRRDYIY
jgi:hypothetical protein